MFSGECQPLAIRRQRLVVVAIVSLVERKFFGLRLALRIEREPVDHAAGIRQQILAVRRPVGRFP